MPWENAWVHQGDPWSSREVTAFPSEVFGCPVLVCLREMLGCYKDVLGCPFYTAGCPQLMLLFPREVLGSSKEMLLF